MGVEGEPTQGLTVPRRRRYEYDPSTGYYLNRATGLYFDTVTGGFYNPSDSKWCALLLVPWIHSGTAA